MLRWMRRRRFVWAYKVLRDEAERHLAAGHQMRFTAVNEAYVVMLCENCPDLQP